VSTFEPQEDLSALVRLVRLFAGQRFKLAIVECSSPVRRRQLTDELRTAVQPKFVGELDLAAVPLSNLWATLRERAEGDVLVLYGLEERPDEQIEDAMVQLNVQRDLFVRDVRVPWVLFVHPARAMALRNRAPDFCDFASLWLRETGGRPLPEPTQRELSFRRAPFEFDDPRLAEVARLAETRAVSVARDALARYDLAGGPGGVDRVRAEAAILYAEGRLADAVAQLQRAAETPGAPATVLAELAFVHLEQGDYASAALRLREAEERDLQDDRERTLLATTRASLDAATGRAQGAIQSLRDEVLPSLEGGEHLRERARTLRELGHIALTASDMATARMVADELFQCASALDDAWLRAEAMDIRAELQAFAGHPDQALHILQNELLPAYTRLGDQRSQAMTMTKIANVFELRGEMDEALRERQRALQLYEQLEDERLAGVTRMEMADVLLLQGEVDEALQVYREVSALFGRLGHPRAQAGVQGRVASVLAMRGQLDEALRIHREEQLPLYEQSGETLGKAHTLRAIADILRLRGDLDGALSVLREQLAVFERYGDLQAQAATLREIAHLLRVRGDGEGALEILRRLLPCFEGVGDAAGRASSLSDIADLLRARGEGTEALRLLRDEVLPLCERASSLRESAIVRSKIADILQDRGEYDTALRIHGAALATYEQFGDVYAQAVTRSKIAEILSIFRGQHEEALRIYREEVLPAVESLGAERDRALTLSRMAAALRASGQTEEALRTYQQALHTFEHIGDLREIGVSLRGIAAVRWDLGDRGEAIRILRDEALPHLERTGTQRVDLLHARALLGRWLLERGRGADRRRARELLSSVCDEASRLRLTDLERSCEILLRQV
jgi:tetratricopeptide (TPR) repeat protein